MARVRTRDYMVQIEITVQFSEMVLPHSETDIRQQLPNPDAQVPRLWPP